MTLLSSRHVCIALVGGQACANHWGAWRKAQVKRQSHTVNKQTAWEDVSLLCTVLAATYSKKNQIKDTDKDYTLSVCYLETLYGACAEEKLAINIKSEFQRKHIRPLL